MTEFRFLKKVLYISYDGLTDPLGQSQVLPYLTELSKRGYQFTILSFEKKYRFGKEKDLVEKLIRDAGIKWVPLWFTSKPPVLSKVYDRWKLRRTAVRLYRREKFEIIHCRSYVAAEVGLFLKRKFDARFLFDMRGFWADEKVDNGQWDQHNYFYRRIYNHYKKKEKDFLLEADGIITLTNAAKNYLLSKPEYKDLSVDVIPCCADFGHFDFAKISSEQIAELRCKLQIPREAKIITYLGSVGGWYMTKEMFSFFKTLSGRFAEYVMLVLTKDNPDEVKKEALANGITPDKIFVTYSNREQLPQYLAISDHGLFFIRNTFSKIASSPTKHAELMAMGLPVICNDIGDTGGIVDSTRTGIVVNDFSETSFKAVADRLHSGAKVNRSYIRDCAKKIFDLRAGADKYFKMYEDVSA